MNTKNKTRTRLIAVALTLVIVIISLPLIPFSVSADPETNIAFGKTTTATTVFCDSNDYLAKWMTDGDSTGTRWNSKGTGTESGSGGEWSGTEEIVIYFNGYYTFDSVKIYWFSGSHAGKEDFYVSSDGINYTPVASFTGTPETTQNVSVSGASGLFLKIVLGEPANSYWGYSIWEIEVSGTAAEWKYPDDENVALGKTASSSSVYADLAQYSASKVVDGSKTDFDNGRWNSQPTVGEEWLLIDLGAVYKVSRLGITWLDWNTLARAVSVSVSINGVDYTDVAGISGNYDVGSNVFAFDDTVKARFVKITLNGAVGSFGYSVYEVEVFGTAELTFSTVSITLQSSFAINFKTNADFGNYKSVYVEASFNSKNYTLDTYTTDGDVKAFSFRNIAPNKLGDSVSATLYGVLEDDTIVTGQTVNYSIKDYCYTLLGETGDSNLKTLLVDLLNYGAESQSYTDYKTEALVNSDLTDEQKGWASSTVAAYTSHADLNYETITDPSVSFISAGLNLRDSVAIRYKIDATDITCITVKISDGSREWVFTESDLVKTTGGYYLYFRGLAANRMRDVVYATVYRNGDPVSNTFSYSIESYASRMYESHPELRNTLDAMMKYGDSAKVYAG